MQDISGSGRAGDAVALTGVNLSLGRGAARVQILKDIDLHIGAGEAIGLVGPSGSGKSTLLMVMAGLERADTGAVVVAGEALGPLQPRHHHQQGRFAGAGRADHSDRLAARYIEVYVLENMDSCRAAAERKIDPSERNGWRTVRSP